jgi:hypothetical protein
MTYQPQSFRQALLNNYAAGTSAGNYIQTHRGNEFHMMTDRWDSLTSYYGCLDTPLVYRFLGMSEEFLRCGIDGIALARRVLAEKSGIYPTCSIEARLDVVHLTALLTNELDAEGLAQSYAALIHLENTDWRTTGRFSAVRRGILLLALGNASDAVAVLARPRSYSGADYVYARVFEFAHAAANGTLHESLVDAWLDYFDMEREPFLGTASVRRERIRGRLAFQAWSQVNLELALITHRYVYSKGEINYPAAADLVFS